MSRLLLFSSLSATSSVTVSKLEKMQVPWRTLNVKEDILIAQYRMMHSHFRTDKLPQKTQLRQLLVSTPNKIQSWVEYFNWCICDGVMQYTKKGRVGNLGLDLLHRGNKWAWRRVLGRQKYKWCRGEWRKGRGGRVNVALLHRLCIPKYLYVMTHFMNNDSKVVMKWLVS